MTILEWLQGKKTYLLMAAAIVYAVGGYFTGHFDGQTALQMVWAALSGMAMRAGISKAVPLSK